MFKVQNTILSEDIATAKFACNVSRCKGACCVVGDAGAPVSSDEISDLEKAYHVVKSELRPQARRIVESEGLINGNEKEGYRLNCTDGKECVFVTYTDEGVAKCSIQKAYYDGQIDWEKPLSCHLFPVRLKRTGEFDYANFEYLPKLCSAGCANGSETGTYLADFLKKPLIRRYGKTWYDEFLQACREVRDKKQEVAEVC